MLDGARKPESKRIDQRITVCFTPGEVKKIKRLAKKANRGVSGYIRDAVKNSMKLQ